MKTLIAVLILSTCAFAQGPTVTLSDSDPSQGVTRLTFYSGGAPQYVCKALSQQRAFTWAVTPTGSQGTLTSIVVATNVGTVTTSTNHGLAIGNSVTVVGSTTAALNAAYKIATVPSVTTFTITTSGVSDGTYNTAALALTTTAPRSSAAIWSIQFFVYGASGETSRQWAHGSPAPAFICDNRATLDYQ